MESIPSNDKDESSDNANEEQLQPEEQEPRSNNGESIDNANRDWPSHVLMSISRGVPAYNAINQGNDMEWKPNVSQIDRQRCTAINRGVQGKRKRDAASFDDEVAVEGTNRGRRHHCCERTSFGVTRTQEIDANVGDDVHSHESVNNLNARHRYWATVLDSTSEEKVGEGSLVAPGSNGAGNSSSQPSQFRACAPVMRGSRQNQQHAVCEMCQTTFKRKYDLKTHIEAVRKFACNGLYVFACICSENSKCTN